MQETCIQGLPAFYGWAQGVSCKVTQGAGVESRVYIQVGLTVKSKVVLSSALFCFDFNPQVPRRGEQLALFISNFIALIDHASF